MYTVIHGKKSCYIRLNIWYKIFAGSIPSAEFPTGPGTKNRLPASYSGRVFTHSVSESPAKQNVLSAFVFWRQQVKTTRNAEPVGVTERGHCSHFRTTVCGRCIWTEKHLSPMQLQGGPWPRDHQELQVMQLRLPLCTLLQSKCQLPYSKQRKPLNFKQIYQNNIAEYGIFVRS